MLKKINIPHLFVYIFIALMFATSFGCSTNSASNLLKDIDSGILFKWTKQNKWEAVLIDKKKGEIDVANSIVLGNSAVKLECVGSNDRERGICSDIAEWIAAVCDDCPCKSGEGGFRCPF